MKEIFFIDFDGTIITSNIAEYILEKYTDERWKYYHDLFIEHKMSLEDVLIAQYSLIKTPINQIIQETDPLIEIRKNFSKFVDYAKDNLLTIQIISGGFDFVIQYILKKINVPIEIKIISVSTSQLEDLSMVVTPPERHDTSIVDFKQDHVKHWKSEGYFVYYIGDSPSDFEASLEADFIFFVRGTSLSSFCKDNKLNFLEFDDFAEIIDFLKLKKKE